jgi:hypothetical protein
LVVVVSFVSAVVGVLLVVPVTVSAWSVVARGEAKAVWPIVVGRKIVFGYCLLDAACCLLAVAYTALAIGGCLLSIIGYWLLAISYRSFSD